MEDRKSFEFRKYYFLKRLEFVEKNILVDPGLVWDCGCGYGTQCLFLAMNGVQSAGSTLEFYYDAIQKRKQYWGKFGNTDLFKVNYENIFENHPTAGSIDYILVGDTLHHLEPIRDAIQIFYKTLKPEWKIVAIEENGSNILQRMILYMRRGNKRIIEIDDEKLVKKILVGNENIRDIDQWEELFAGGGFQIEEESTEFVRLFTPAFFNLLGTEKIKNLDSELWRQNKFIRKYFYFGTNFIVSKRLTAS
ncbi:MAG: class I SAM-dependent methyltransferase [Ignavibacteriaceae bacterium]|nr:class I SAM-dependent methyltransferase [Ignavibacteriaceae bacterium]